MKTAKIISVGGLGNQLFIFSFAHRLLENGYRKVEIEISWHTDKMDRPFELGGLLKSCNHNIEVRNSRFILNLSRFAGRLVGTRTVSARHMCKYFGVFVEQNDRVNLSEVHNWPWLFIGYFQDFELLPSRNDMKEELQLFLYIQENKSYTFSENYQVAHVRIGDYVNLRDTFGVLSPEFYINQIQTSEPITILTESRADLDYRFHSLPNLNVIDSIDSSAWDVLSILSRGKRLILSNSSLSWWGGFLNRHEEAMITIPNPWFKQNAGTHQNLNYEKFNYQVSTWE